MIDIETMSTKPEALVLTIGATEFSLGDSPKCDNPTHFYAAVCKKDSERLGRHVEQSTLEWWEKQSKAAQEAAFNAPNAVPLKTALEGLIQYCILVRERHPSGKLHVWGNDPTFDTVILERSFEAVGLPEPWKYFETRSCRTYDSIGETLGFRKKRDLPRTGVHHNALDDCIYQAEVVKAIDDRLVKASQLFQQTLAA